MVKSNYERREMKKILWRIEMKIQIYKSKKKELSRRGNSRAKYNCIISELNEIKEDMEKLL